MRRALTRLTGALLSMTGLAMAEGKVTMATGGGARLCSLPTGAK